MKTKTTFFYLGIFILEILLLRTLSQWHYFINQIYFPVYEFFRNHLINISHWFPFSIGDIMYGIIGLLILFLVGKSFKIVKEKKNISKSFKLGSSFLIIYYCFWGFLYEYQPYSKYHNLPSVTIVDLKKLSIKLLNSCKDLREKCTENEQGIYYISNPTEITQTLYSARNSLENQILHNQLTPSMNVKKSIYSPMISYFGISGYYNPFTMEAQYNACIPHNWLPFTLAHEMAHQVAVAKEQDANFVGYVMSMNSKENQIVYSAKYSALKYVLGAIYPSDTLFVKDIRKQYSKKMQKDRKIELEYIQQHKGITETMFSKLNDWFLLANKQKGIESYGLFIPLLVEYEKTH